MITIRRRAGGWTAGLVVIVTSLISLPLSGQDVPNPFIDPDQAWAKITQPIWERELRDPAVMNEWADFRPDPTPSESAARGLRPIVSAEELRHPLSKKGKSLIAKAQQSVKSGNHLKAIEELNAAAQEPSAAPYAQGILGTEYLKINNLPEAIRHLEEAIALMPKAAAEHSNLGYALCLAGKGKRGLKEIETALSLDWTLARARFLKGAILLEQGSRDKEAWDNLEAAQREVPTAHLALAIYYVRHGQGAAADQQLRDYAEMDRGVSLTKARKWLDHVADDGTAAGEALGLWPRLPSDAGE